MKWSVKKFLQRFDVKFSVSEQPVTMTLAYLLLYQTHYGRTKKDLTVDGVPRRVDEVGTPS